MALKIAAGLGLYELPFASASGFWRWVDLCEQGGVKSIWQSDRLTGRTPTLECLSTMAALAGRTRRLKFGMNVLSMALREPVLVARQCATIDFLSAGRLLPGFGIGGPQLPDWEAMNVPTAGRGTKTDEALEIVGRLWRGETVSFDGKFHRLREVSISPLPVQAELPIWIGGASNAAIRRTARYGTGWQGGLETPEEAGPVVAAINAAATGLGRTIDPDHFGVGIFARLGRSDEPCVVRLEQQFAQATAPSATPRIAAGEPADILARIAAYVAVGISKFVLRPIAADEEDFMHQSRALIERVLPLMAKRGFSEGHG